MGAIQKMLERMGFVRLRDYGLLLTPDRRVVTTRPIVDDGMGTRVVGWTGSDLPTLASWEDAPEPAPRAPLFAPEPVVQPLALAPTIVAPVVAAPKPVAEPEPVAEEEGPEDEWEWEIAMARARAAAEPQPHPHTTSQWLTSEPLTGGWREDTAIRSVTQLARASEQRFARGSEQLPAATPQPRAATVQPVALPMAARTILPVPALPVAQDASQVRVFDQESTRRIPLPRRFPKATGRVTDDVSTTALPVRAAARR